MTTVTLKRGYRLPKLRQQLKQADGTPVPLTGASVRLHEVSIAESLKGRTTGA